MTLATFCSPTMMVGPFGMSDDHLKFSVPQIKQKITDWLYDRMNGVVQSGPFVGMKVPYSKAWRDDSLGTQVLGCYEQELHPFIEDEIRRLLELPHPKIVDIGCAGGYYAVGMACRVSTASVWIIDSNPDAVEIALEAGVANGRVLVANRTVPETLADADLVISDCEGAERKYMDPFAYPSLTQSSIIVECHEFADERRGTTQLLCERFNETHVMAQVLCGPRNPTQHEVLRPWHQTTQWLAVDEGRPATMAWLVMRPRSRISEYKNDG